MLTGANIISSSPRIYYSINYCAGVDGSANDDDDDKPIVLKFATRSMERDLVARLRV